jgi:hypothetical protein
LLEAQQQQHHHQQHQQQQHQHQGVVGVVQATGPIPTAPESPGRPSAQEQQVVGSPVAMKMEGDAATMTGGTSSSTSEAAVNAGSAATASLAPQTSSSTTPATNTASSTSSVLPTTLPTTASQDAPGIQLLIESLRAGQSGGSAPPLDEAVRNYIKQQQMAQQQAHQTSNVASAIKTESN